MDKRLLQTAKEIAIAAAFEAGRLMKSRFDRLDSYEKKGEYGDIVTEVDYLTEAIILEKITSIFPEHQIRSEEIGDNRFASDWMWMVDPLDGTNNYALGVPLFSTSITLLYKQEPVLAVIYEPMVDRLFVSSLGEGSFCNRVPIQVKRTANLGKATVGWIQGHGVRNDPNAVKLRHHIENHFKRVMRMWSPTLQWNMLAKGDLEGIILYNSEGEDLYSGILMVKEAGGVVVDYEGKPFTKITTNPYLIACHPEHQEAFLQIVQGGLKE